MAEIKIKELKQRHVEHFLRTRREIQAGMSGLTPQGYGDALVGFAGALKAQKLEPGEFAVTLEKYVTGLLKIDEQKSDITQLEMNGVNVRSAARLDWFDDLVEAAVDDMEPWRVIQLSDEIIQLYNDALTVPKD